MRSWTRQVLISNVYPLSLYEKKAERGYCTDIPFDVHRAWFNSTLSFRYSHNYDEEREVQADLFEVGSTHTDGCLGPFNLNTVGYHDALMYGVNFRWMHIKLDSPEVPVLGLLEDLVKECPCISDHLKTVALKVILEASEQHSELTHRNPEVCTGNIIRYVGRHQAYPTHDDLHYNQSWDTEPVMFVSTPFLTVELDKARNRSSSGNLSRSPLEFIYGAGSKNDQPFWLAEATVNSPKLHITRMMRVPEASFLLIGSEVLISISSVPWKLMLPVPATITINREDERPQREFYSVQIIYDTDIGVDSLKVWKGCSYGDFLRKSLGLSQDEELNLSSYRLVDESKRTVDHLSWSKYLKSGEVERHEFSLIDCSSETSTVHSNMSVAAPPVSESQKSNKSSSVSFSDSVSRPTVVYYILPELPPSKSTLREPSQSSFEILYYKHSRAIMNQKDNIQALLSLGVDLDERPKQKFPCFLSQSLGQDTIESLVIDGYVELRHQKDKLQQSILQTPYTDLLTDPSAYTRHTVYDRCKILCLVTGNELSPLAFEPHGQKHWVYEIHRPFDILKLQSIFTLSDEIFSYFLPESSTVAACSVSKRYWGALDLQIYLSTLLVPKSGQFAISPLLTFVTQGDLGIALKDLPDDSCEHCINGAVYSSIHDALNHLHQHHIKCHHNDQDTSMLNDPCAIWVYSKLLDPKPDEETFEPASSFYRDLMKMLSNVKGICASNVVDDQNMKISLGHYFSNIICRFLLAAAHSLSINKALLEDSETDMGHNEYEFSYINSQIDAINDKMKEQFRLVTHHAKVSGMARNGINRPITADIGPEFLLANLIINLQRWAIDPNTGSRMDANAFCKIFHLAGQPSAVKDLRRRRILEISALEEEMDALCVITEIQRRVNKAYTKILGPDFFQQDTTDDEYVKNRSKRP
ncbi:mg2+ transporter [Fusarium bulbicola]|nr:mg2+ transporter [Fusarium bulbicola]